MNLAGLLAGLGLLELWFGGRALDPLSIPRDVELRFDVRDLYDSPDGPTITYRRDKYGLRGLYVDPGSIEILTIGGSTADQRYLDDQRTWQSVLQRSFVRDGRGVEVVNAGVDGQSTRGNLANFEYWFPRIPGLHPRFVLVYVGTNDFFLNASDATTFDDLRDQSYAARLLGRSGVYDLYRRLKGAYLARYVFRIEHGGLRPSHTPWTKNTVRSAIEWRTDSKVAAKLSGFEERLRRLDEAIRRLGSEAVFVTQVGRHFKTSTGGQVLGLDYEWLLFGHRGNGVDIAHLMRMQATRTLATCKALGAICIDTTGVHFDDQDYYDVVHTTPSGAEKVGQVMYESLREYF